MTVLLFLANACHHLKGATRASRLTPSGALPSVGVAIPSLFVIASEHSDANEAISELANQ